MSEATALAPEAVDREIAEIEDLMATDRAAYLRDAPRQARLRALYGIREGGKARVDEDGAGMELMAPVPPGEFHKMAPGGDYQAYLRQVSAAGDVMIRVPAAERAGFAATFERLPQVVAGTMMAVLTDRATLVPEPVSDAQIAFIRAQVPGGAAVVAEWGAQARDKAGRVRAKLWRVIERLEETEGETFLRWLEGLSGRAAAAVYRKLGE